VIRLLLDQGLPRSTVEILRASGWDVVHAHECGLSLATDEQILEYARENSRTICTLDADFHALLAVSGATAPSVLRIRKEGLRGADVASLLQRTWNETGISASIEHGAVVSITERAIRVRQLPIGSARNPSRSETDQTAG
jgi:predicted nuclease of predicted toxin-antitoxin system